MSDAPRGCVLTRTRSVDPDNSAKQLYVSFGYVEDGGDRMALVL